jgi:hypothetical protein
VPSWRIPGCSTRLEDQSGRSADPTNLRWRVPEPANAISDAGALKRESRAAAPPRENDDASSGLHRGMATLISARTIASVDASVAERERERSRRSTPLPRKGSRSADRSIDSSIGRPILPPGREREKLKAVVPIKLAACRLAMMAKLGDRRDEFAEFAPAVNGISTWPRGAREICVARRDAAPPSFPCASGALINAFNVRAAEQLISWRNAIIAYRSFPIEIRSAMGSGRANVSNANVANRIEGDVEETFSKRRYTSRVRLRNLQILTAA